MFDIGVLSLLDSVKVYLNLTKDSSKDDVLKEIIDNTYNRLLAYTGYQEIPQGLLWVVKEVSCSRYNQLGSEGIHSELNEGIQFIYDKDIFSEYYPVIDRFLYDNPPENKKRFRMI